MMVRPSLRYRPLARSLSVCAFLAAWHVADDACASVTGSSGIEFEGPRDRRGFFFATGVGFGGAYYDSQFAPGMRFAVLLGGGITQRLTLGLEMHVTPYLRTNYGVEFGGDLEATGFVWEGLYVRAGVGGGGVPIEAETARLSGAVGGLVGIGYEFFLNQTAAMGVGVHYDIRYVPTDRIPRQGGFAGIRFAWY